MKDGCEEVAPAVGAGLVEDGLDVVVGGVRGDLQRRGDLLRRQAPQEQCEGFCFSWCERVRGDDRWFELSAGRWFEWKNRTQDEAAAALEPYLGSLWSKANYSAAERSVNGPRVRQFDADEIIAFARASNVAIVRTLPS